MLDYENDDAFRSGCTMFFSQYLYYIMCYRAKRSILLAFAEELYLYCQVNNINFPVLRDALNTKWNVEILEPGDGIGGHCLPKDTKMFLQSSKSLRSKILAAAMEVDEDYKIYRANLYLPPETKVSI